MRFDRPEWPAGLGGDLTERQVAEEAQGHHLTIWLVEPSDGFADVGRPLRSKRDGRGIGTTGHVRRSGIGRIQPGDAASTLRSADCDPDGNPGQPRTERAVLTPRAESAKRGHERFLRCILGLVKVTEDSVAGADDRLALAVDENPERIAIAGQDAGDDGSVVGGDIRR
jgi:hypothetical protein